MVGRIELGLLQTRLIVRGSQLAHKIVGESIQGSSPAPLAGTDQTFPFPRPVVIVSTRLMPALP